MKKPWKGLIRCLSTQPWPTTHSMSIVLKKWRRKRPTSGMDLRPLRILKGDGRRVDDISPAKTIYFTQSRIPGCSTVSSPWRILSGITIIRLVVVYTNLITYTKKGDWGWYENLLVEFCPSNNWSFYILIIFKSTDYRSRYTAGKTSWLNIACHHSPRSNCSAWPNTNTVQNRSPGTNPTICFDNYRASKRGPIVLSSVFCLELMCTRADTHARTD